MVPIVSPPILNKQIQKCRTLFMLAMRKKDLQMIGLSNFGWLLSQIWVLCFLLQFFCTSGFGFTLKIVIPLEVLHIAQVSRSQEKLGTHNCEIYDNILPTFVKQIISGSHGASHRGLRQEVQTGVCGLPRPQILIHSSLLYQGLIYLLKILNQRILLI